MQYNYEARTQYGEIQSGVIEVSDEKSAIDFLQRHNLIVISIKAVGRTTDSLAQKYLPFLYKVKKSDLALFSRQMAILIEAKVSLVQALRAVVDQSENKVFKDMIYDIASDVEAGMTFSAALNKYPDAFSLFYINLIKSGEASGDLEGMLIYLAGHLEKESELDSKVKGAFIYPAVISIVFVLVGIVFMVFIVPQITSMFKETGKELPFITKIVIMISDTLINYMPFLLVGAIGLSWLIRYWLKYQEGYLIWDKVKLKIPVFGALFKKIYITQFSENLSTLLTGGIALIQALHISADVIENSAYKKMIIEAANKVKTGETISAVFGQYGSLMPSMVVTMIKIGEKTGKLDSVLKKIAYFYGREVDQVVSNISSLIEPVIILTLGVGAAILVAAILLPIYDIAGA